MEKMSNIEFMNKLTSLLFHAGIIEKSNGTGRTITVVVAKDKDYEEEKIMMRNCMNCSEYVSCNTRKAKPDVVMCNKWELDENITRDLADSEEED